MSFITQIGDDVHQAILDGRSYVAGAALSSNWKGMMVQANTGEEVVIWRYEFFATATHTNNLTEHDIGWWNSAVSWSAVSASDIENYRDGGAAFNGTVYSRQGTTPTVMTTYLRRYHTGNKRIFTPDQVTPSPLQAISPYATQYFDFSGSLQKGFMVTPNDFRMTVGDTNWGGFSTDFSSGVSGAMILHFYRKV